MTSITARLVGATALALVLSASAYAQDPSGFVSASIANTEIDVGGGDDDFTSYSLGGSYYNNLGSLNLQATGVYSYADTDPDEVDGFGGELALFGRTDGHALGGFASVTDSEDSTIWGVGGEGQIFRGSWTWGASGGWFDGDDAFDSLYGACGFGRLYGNENFALEGRGVLGEVDYGVGDDTVYGVGAGAEYQFMGSPFSLTGDVDWASADDADVDATAFRLGGKLHFGTGSLMQRDREGAGMRGGSCLSGVSAL
jgi:hypothetical protein